jgi:uncharacterized Tic20 family protein
LNYYESQEKIWLEEKTLLVEREEMDVERQQIAGIVTTIIIIITIIITIIIITTIIINITIIITIIIIIIIITIIIITIVTIIVGRERGSRCGKTTKSR